MDPINPTKPAEGPEHVVSKIEPRVEEQAPNVASPKPASKTGQPSNHLTVVSVGIFIILCLAAVGFFYNQNQQLKQMLASYQNQPPPLPTGGPVATPDPTANWKTYTSTTHNFSFRYPSSWVLDSTKDNLTQNSLVKLTNGQSSIQISTNITGITGGATDCQGTAITISSQNLFECKESNLNTKLTTINISDSSTLNAGIFQFGANKTYYSISLTYPSSVEQTQQGIDSQNTFNKILSTFQFTNPSSSPSSIPVSSSSALPLNVNGQ